MLRRIILALLIAAAPAVARAQSYGSPIFTAVTVGGAGGQTITGVGTTAGTVAAGNDSRIVGAAQNAAASITGGTINGTAIGGSVPAAVTGTTITGNSLIGPLTGNASTATALATPRTFSLSGDVSGSASFDGTASPTIAATLAASGVPAGSYGSASAIPVLTIDGKGRVTSASTAAITASGAVVPPQGRLTLTSGAPVLSATVSGATSVIYTPHLGNLIPLWNGSAFVMTAFTEVSQALSDASKSPSAAAAANVYDLFAWSDGGTVRVTRGPAWAAGAVAGSNTVRGTGAGSTALTRVNGILTNAVAIINGASAGFGTYVGTVATDASGATVSWVYGSSASGGGAAILNVWNAYNRIPVETQVFDSSASHSYSSSTPRAYNNSTANRITFVRGLDEDGVFASFEGVCQVTTADGAAYVGVGLDTTSAFTVQGKGYVTNQSWGGTVISTYRGRPGLGAHYVQMMESVAVGATFYSNAPNGQSAFSFSGRF